MLEYHKFKLEYLKNIYSINKITDKTITEHYNEFSDGIVESEKIASSLLLGDGIIESEDSFKEMFYTDDSSIDEYDQIILKSLEYYLEDVYGNETLNDSGRCLVNNLIGRACQMIHNEDLLGVVRGFDEGRPRLLIVDFGDKEEVKVDIDELIIAGQKRK